LIIRNNLIQILAPAICVENIKKEEKESLNPESSRETQEFDEVCLECSDFL